MPELGGGTALETILRESREAGFCGTEMGGAYPREAAALRPLLEAHGLVLASGWFGGLLRENGSVAVEMRRMRAQLACFAELGVRTLFYADTSGSVQALAAVPLSARPRMAAAEFAPYGARLTELAERMAAEYGIAMAYHHHMGTLIETDGEVAALMANTGEAVGLLADSGHIAFAGGDAAELVRRYARRVRYVHCKDLREEVVRRALAEDWSFMQAVLAGAFTVPGDGCLDFGAFVGELAAVNYRGWLVVEAEQDPAVAPALEYSRRGGAHIRVCCAAAGMGVRDEIFG